MLKLLKNLNKKCLIYGFISFVLICVGVYFDLKIPDYMSEITTLVQTTGSTMSDIIEQGIYMVLCAFGSLISAIIVGYLVANIAAIFSRNTRKKLFDKVENLDMAHVKNLSTSSLITRTTNDITQVEMFVVMGVQLLFKAPITAIWAITKIVNKSWEWSLITAISVVVLLIVIGIIVIVVLPKFKKIQSLIDKLNNVTRENLTGIRVVRAFNAEGYEEKKFSVVNNDITNLQIFVQKGFSVLMPVMYIVMYFLTLSIYFVGAYLIDGAGLTQKIGLFSDMIVFSAYAMQIIMSFLMLAVVFMILPRAQVSADRINEVMDTDIDIKNGNVTNNSKDLVGTIEYKNVYFKYPDADEYLLEDISFKANKGETIAFIGSTGSGKSTLINLIPRFYDATKGTILVDGVDVKEYDEEYLRNKIGYVPQKAVMFNGSINYNVSYGRNGKTDIKKRIKEALRIAQAEDFVSKMEKKEKSHISSGGTNISGGQKQRLAIARAIARDPEIYIFDDSFSALDYKTDAILRKELRNYTKDSTNLIVAQRIGTVLNADKIIVLDEGKCVGIGTHKELMKNCKVYKEIALSQLSKEELENA